MKYILSVFVVMSIIITTSCKKEAGEGGNSSIFGQIWVRDYNVNFSWLNGEYPGYDEDVYIIYGEDITYGDRIRSGPDGMFEFKYLRKGDYRIYVYSKDSTMNSVSGDTVFFRDVTISAKKERVDAGTIIIYD